MNIQIFNKIPGFDCNKKWPSPLFLMGYVSCRRFFSVLLEYTPTFHITYLYKKNNNNGISIGSVGVLIVLKNKYHKTREFAPPFNFAPPQKFVKKTQKILHHPWGKIPKKCGANSRFLWYILKTTHLSCRKILPHPLEQNF